MTLLRDLQSFFGVVFKIKVEEGFRAYEDSDSESNENDSDSNSADSNGEEGGDVDVNKESEPKRSATQERGIVLSCVGIGHSNISRQRF